MTASIASRAEEIFLSAIETKILQQRILLLLLNLHQQGYTDFYTNCAWGVPLWSAECVWLMKSRYPEISLHLAIPHKQQAQHWEYASKKRYLQITRLADTIHYISSPDDIQSFLKTDRFMMEHSDLLLYYGKQGFLEYATRHQNALIEAYAHTHHIPIRYI